MSIAEEVAAGVANAAGPIADHIVNSLTAAIKEAVKSFSGKEITITIKLPEIKDA